MNVFKKILSILLFPFKIFFKLSKKGKIIYIIIVLVFTGIIISNLIQSTLKPKYSLVKVSRGEVTELVSETGQIDTNNKTDIFSTTNGIVTEVNVANDQIVKANDNLLVIKSTASESEKSQARSDYLSAKANLETSEGLLFTLQAQMFSSWDSYKKLAEGDTYENSDGSPKEDMRTLPEFVISQKNWQGAEASFKKQKTVVDQAKSALNTASIIYQSTQDSIVKATSDGVVANLSVSPGKTVKVKSQIDLTPLLSLVTTNDVEAIVALSENDVIKVKPDQEVTINLNALHNKEYNGKIVRVDSLPTNIGGVNRYNAYIKIENSDDSLRTGMNIDVKIVTNKKSDVLMLPNSSIKPYKGGRAVRIVGDSKEPIKYVPVEIGVRGQAQTEIVNGVSEGQEIIATLSNEQIKRTGIFGN